MNILEESITDFNLLELQYKHPTEIKTQKYSRVRENVVGADWEWWFTSGGYWLGLRVQAKKLDERSMTYPEVDSTDKRGRRQIDVLIREALASTPKRIPMYVFYNCWDKKAFRPRWKCLSYRQNYEMLGCGISHAAPILQIVNRNSKSIRDVSRHMYPWSCLLCCRGFSPSNVLPERIRDFIFRAYDTTEVMDFPEDAFITQKPPRYVYSIAEGILIPEEQWEEVPVNLVTVVSAVSPVIATYHIPLTS